MSAGTPESRIHDLGTKAIAGGALTPDEALTLYRSLDQPSLGLLAKLSILAKRHFDYVPTLISTRSDITRILLSMGFDDVFHIVEVPLERTTQLGELPELVTSEDDMRERVLEAHQTLISMNESNRETFQDLVAALEAEEQPVMERRRASR